MAEVLSFEPVLALYGETVALYKTVLAGVCGSYSTLVKSETSLVTAVLSLKVDS